MENSIVQCDLCSYIFPPFRFLEHVKNEESPLPPIGNHHAFFSDDPEPSPVTEIANLIHDSYEVK